ncbi:RNase H family protein [Gordonia hirsuta]|uniref:RNase H family protein n=1 Tax=Gordonia hirsuta TaxID=53427 RepID=UPI0034E1CAC2
MAPVPVARPLAPGIVVPTALPTRELHIALAPDGPDRFRYRAVCGDRIWQGTGRSPFARAVLLDALVDIRRDVDPAVALRVAARVPGPGLGDRHAAGIEAHLPRLWISRAEGADRAALDDLEGRLIRQIRHRSRSADPLVIATDGSAVGRFTGHSWLAASGRFGLGGRKEPTRVRGSLALLAELRAIDAAIKDNLYQRLHVLTDCRPALAVLDRWRRGDDRPHHIDFAWDCIPGEVRDLRDAVQSDTGLLSFSWTPGHLGLPLNEGADGLARLALRRLRGREAITKDRFAETAEGLAEAFAAAYRTSPASGNTDLAAAA